jgi:hypothetical protein
MNVSVDEPWQDDARHPRRQWRFESAQMIWTSTSAERNDAAGSDRDPPVA